MVITSAGQPRPGKVIRTPIPYAAGSTLRGGSVDFPTGNDVEIGTDNVLLKTYDHKLLSFRNVIFWGDLPKGTATPLWWNAVTISGRPHGARVGTLVLQSVDCGQTWQRLSVIDPMAFEGGRYAVPRPPNDFGGWDRVEAYADPWTGYLYTSMNATGGAQVIDAQGNVTTRDCANKSDLDNCVSTQFVFRSTDHGATWTEVLNFAAWTPIVMTSTPNGRLDLFSQLGDTPTIWYTLLNKPGVPGVTFSTGQPIFYSAVIDGAPSSLKAASDPVSSVYSFKVNSISRASVDKTSQVRVSYDFIDDRGRTAVAMLNVEVKDENQPPTVTPYAMLQASMESHSILQSSFVDPDATTARDRLATTSMFYWIEGDDPEAEWVHTEPDPTKWKPENRIPNSRIATVKGSNEQTSRFLLVRNGPPVSESFDLTGGAAPTSPLIKSGDYAYGAAYSNGDFLHFIGQWTEPGKIVANSVVVALPPSGVSGGTGGGTTHPVLTCDKMRAFINSLQQKVLHHTATPAEVQNLSSDETFYETKCLSKNLPHH